MKNKSLSFFLLAAFLLANFVNLSTSAFSGFLFNNPETHPEQFLQQNQTQVEQNNSAIQAFIEDLRLVSQQCRSDHFLTPKTGIPDGNFYSVAFETKLNPNSYPGVSRYMHFKEANIALDNAMTSNPLLKNLGINVPKSPTGSILGKSPTDWVWHHSIDDGVMQLVPKIQHPSIPGGPFWETMHPNGVGGYSLWGK